MADRLIREGSPPSGLLASPVPQYWNPAADGGLGAYEKVQGVNGASRVLLYDGNGQPLLTETNPGHVVLSGRTSLVSISDVADSSVHSAQFPVAHIVGIYNDGDADLFVSFNGSTWFRVKTGEALVNVPLSTSMLYYTADGSPVPFRAVGVA